jgi:hypothetical protein
LTYKDKKTAISQSSIETGFLEYATIGLHLGAELYNYKYKNHGEFTLRCVQGYCNTFSLQIIGKGASSVKN